MKPLAIILSLTIASCAPSKPQTRPEPVIPGKRVEARNGMDAQADNPRL